MMICRGGLFNRHGCGQEQWAWDMRSEPALIDVFSKIWGTEELLVSIGKHLKGIDFVDHILSDVMLIVWQTL